MWLGATPLTRGAAWAVPVACAALLAVGLGLAVAADATRVAEGEVLANISLSLGFGTVGALIVSRQPRHPLGLLHLGVATASALTVFAYAYAYFGLIHRPGSLPGALAAAWVSAWIWTLGFSPAATLGLLLFPDGRLPSVRWRWAAALPVLGITGLWLRAALSPGPLINHPVAENPLGIPGAEPVLRVFAAVGFPLVLAGVVAGIASLVVRWRRSEPAGLRRRQISLLVLAAVATLAVAASPGRTDNATSIVVGLVVMASIPAAVGVAILRHRLYDIDVAVNRSLVYGGLTLAVLIAYAAAVALAGRAAGDSPSLLPGLVAAAVAVGLLPLRGRLQRGVDRLMYGDRGDPYAAVSGLATRLSAVGAPGEALGAITSTIRDSLRVSYVALEVDGRTTATAGSVTQAAALRQPVIHRGESLGELLIVAGSGRALDGRDRALLTELVRQAGPALLAARLTDALHESRQRLVTAREEERRRLRRDLHDGPGPTLAGVALGIDVAVGKLDGDPGEALAMLKEVRDEANMAVEDIRRIAYGLRPPALDELGLLGALRREAERLGRSRPALVISVQGSAGEIAGLDAAVEVAAYRIAAEAMTKCGPAFRGRGSARRRVRRGRPGDHREGRWPRPGRGRSRRGGNGGDARTSRGGGRVPTDRELACRHNGVRTASAAVPVSAVDGPGTEEALSILVADDHPLYRRGLAALLDSQDGWAVIAEAEDGLSAITQAHPLDPDIVVMDITMPKVDGIEATRRITGASPRTGILVLTMYDDDDSVFAAMRAGARGYVLKGADHADIVRAVAAVSRGEAIFGPSVAARIVEFFAAPRRAVDASVFPALGQREHDVLDLIAAGRNNTDIAGVLELSPKTVRNHVSNIFAKLQVADRAEAIVRAREAGLGR